MSEAREGECVYVHYSGHGAREKNSLKSAYQLGNLALFPFEDNQSSHPLTHLRVAT